VSIYSFKLQFEENVMNKGNEEKVIKKSNEKGIKKYNTE
jgi:hypothetical protein